MRIYLMRKNENKFTAFQFLKMSSEYNIILNTISIFGDFINVTGDENNIKSFMKRFNLKKVEEDYYNEYAFEKAYKKQFEL